MTISGLHGTSPLAVHCNHTLVCCTLRGSQGAGMLIQLGLIVASVISPTIPAASVSLHDAFNSQQAYAYTAEVADFGERWPGSPGHKKTEDLIHQVLQRDGAQTEADDFIA